MLSKPEAFLGYRRGRQQHRQQLLQQHRKLNGNHETRLYIIARVGVAIVIPSSCRQHDGILEIVVALAITALIHSADVSLIDSSSQIPKFVSFFRLAALPISPDSGGRESAMRLDGFPILNTA